MNIVERMVKAAQGADDVGVALLRAGFTTAEILEYHPEVSAALHQRMQTNGSCLATAVAA